MTKRKKADVASLTEEAAEMYKAGLTDVRQIAVELDISVPYTYNLLQRAGVTLLSTSRPGSNMLSEEEINEIVKVFLDRERPIKDVLEQYHISYNVLYRILIEKGVDIPAYQDRKREANELRLAVALRMYTDGAPLKVITDTTGIRQPQLHTALRDAGIKMRQQHNKRKAEDWVSVKDTIDPIP